MKTVAAMTAAERASLAQTMDGPPGADGTPTSARTLYIGGLAPGVTSLLLYELAARCGAVRMARVPAPAAQSSAAGASRFAFVEFEHEASAHYAARALSGLALCGSVLRAAPRAGEAAASDAGGGAGGDAPAEPGAQVFVRPLPDGVDEWDLWDLGALACDGVAAVRLPRDRDGRPRGFGFIVYRRADDGVRVALPVLAAGLALAGRPVSVSLSDASAAAISAAGGLAGTAAAQAVEAAAVAAAAAAAAAAGEEEPVPPAAISLGGGAPALPIDATLVNGLRIEAVQAHCRRIDARLAAAMAAATAAAAAVVAAK